MNSRKGGKRKETSTVLYQLCELRTTKKYFFLFPVSLRAYATGYTRNTLRVDNTLNCLWKEYLFSFYSFTPFSMIVSVGIDVGKDSCFVALRHENGAYTERSFANSPEGADACMAFFRERGVVETTPLVLESTGGYHLLFAMTLKDTHFRGVKVINAILTKKYQKSKIRKTKTDKTDAKMLATIGLMEDVPCFTMTPEQIVQKKRMSLLRQLQKTRQHLRSSLQSSLEVGKNLQVEIPTDGIKKILASIDEEIRHLEHQMVEACHHPLLEKLVEIEGISPAAAAVFVAMLEGKNFSSKEKLVAFAGLDLSVRESGTSIHGERHLSKRGDAFVRKKLFQTAWALKMHNPKYQEYYLKKRREKKHYYTCLIAVARKFLHHLYALQKEIQPHNLTHIST